MFLLERRVMSFEFIEVSEIAHPGGLWKSPEFNISLHTQNDDRAILDYIKTERHEWHGIKSFKLYIFRFNYCVILLLVTECSVINTFI